MRGRTTLPQPVTAPVAPLVFLLFLVMVELVLIAYGLVLWEAGWRHLSPSPVPMVTDVQLVTR